MAAWMELDLLFCVALVSEGCTFFNHARESRWLAMLVVGWVDGGGGAVPVGRSVTFVCCLQNWISDEIQNEHECAQVPGQVPGNSSTFPEKILILANQIDRVSIFTYELYLFSSVVC